MIGSSGSFISKGNRFGPSIKSGAPGGVYRKNVNRSGGFGAAGKGGKFRFRPFLNPSLQTFLGILLVFFICTKFYGGVMVMPFLSKVSMLLTLALAGIIILNNINIYKKIHYLVFIIFAVQFVLSRNITMLYAYFLALALYNINFRLVMKVFILTNVLLFCIMIVLNLTGMRPSEFIHGRNDFGFGNPNSAFLGMFLIWITYAYLIFDKMNKFDVALLVIMGIIMFSQTGTRTGLLTIIVSGIIMFFYKSEKFRNSRIIKWLSVMFPVLMTGLSLVITYFMYDSLFLNKMLSHRPLYWNRYFTDPRSGLNLFGYAANIRDTLFMPRVPLDSGYLWALFSQGIIVYVILMVLICISLKKLFDEGRKAEIVLMLSILVYCFAESIMLELGNNIPLILIVYAMFSSGGKSPVGRR